MSFREEFEEALGGAVERMTGADCPPRLARALRHAVLGGGKRLRPTLLMKVAEAHHGGDRRVALGAAVSLELLHAASLVHDDLPAFDDAELRRGMPTVHRLYGEAVAVLAGDALIVHAFETVALEAAHDPLRMAAVIRILSGSVGAHSGIVAGQAWESEPRVELERYHRLKTGALFEAAVRAGAVAGGGNAREWTGVGEALGRAYQAADDLHDLLTSPMASGKTSARDGALGRPNLGLQLGVGQAAVEVRRLAARAAALVPPVPGAERVRGFILDALAAWIPEVPQAAEAPALEVNH